MKLVSLLLFFTFNLSAALIPEATLNQNSEMEMIAGHEAQFRLGFKMLNGRYHRMYHRMHAKLMHTIIVNEDLSHFVHLHPELDRSGVFNLSINGHSSDPDNHELPNAIPWNGNYYLFTESMPHNHSGGEMVMQYTRHQISATNGIDGSPQADQHWPDARSGITHYFSQGDKKLKAVLEYETYDFCDRWVPKFYLSLFEENEDGEFVAADGFQNWLEMGGHGVLIEKSNRPFNEKRFQHLHAFLPIAVKGEFDFPFDAHIDELQSGDYKIWFQLKRYGEVLTLPFAFHYDKPQSLSKCR